jgi:peptide deformylase
VSSEITVEEWAAKAGLPEGVARPVTMRGTPVLHRGCQPVTAFDDALKQLVADMFESMDAAEGVGLAANQIGVDARVFVYDCPDADGEHQVGCVINPVVLPAPEGVDLSEEPEGCLSVPREFAELARPALATVTGFDLEGREIRVEGSGLLARCLQHETDHLNGILYVDRLSEERRAAVLAAHEQRIQDGELPEWSAGAHH